MDFKLNIKENEFRIGEYNTRLHNIREKIERAIASSLYAIERSAKQNCPVDLGGLRQSIMVDIFPDRIGGRVVCMENHDPPYGAYVEFGTGPNVMIPEGLEDYAMKFFVNGRGHMPANPFLFPAFFDEQPRLLNVLENSL